MRPSLLAVVLPVATFCLGAAGQPAAPGTAARVLGAALLAACAGEARRAASEAAAEERRERLRKEVASSGLLKILGSAGRRGEEPADVLGSMGIGVDMNTPFGSMGAPGATGFGGLGLGGSGVGGGGTEASGIGGLGARGGGGSGAVAGYGGGGSVGIGGLGKPRPEPRVRLGEGGPEPLRAHARRKLARLERCYRSALAGRADLAGEISLELAADTEGKIQVLSVRGDGPEALHACARSAILGRLPAAPAAALQGSLTLTLDPGAVPAEDP